MAKNVRHKLPQKIKTDWTLCYIVFFVVLTLENSNILLTKQLLD